MPQTIPCSLGTPLRRAGVKSSMTKAVSNPITSLGPPRIGFTASGWANGEVELANCGIELLRE